MLRINVVGGTKAGWRKVRAQARDWKCPSCGAKLRYFWTSCPNCGAPRPE